MKIERVEEPQPKNQKGISMSEYHIDDSKRKKKQVCLSIESYATEVT